jgi:hypothetical protein
MATLTKGLDGSLINYYDIKVDTDTFASISVCAKDAAAYMRDAAYHVNNARRHENWQITETERERVNSEVRQLKAHSERIAGFLDSLSTILETALGDFESTQTEIISKMDNIAYTVAVD